jgi:hypothetical protein
MWPLVMKSGASWIPSSPFSWLCVTATWPIWTVVSVVGFQSITRPSRSM